MTQGAAARMNKIVALLWESTFDPMGQMMLTNHRQEIDETRFKIIVGEADFTPDIFAMFKADPATLVQSNDVFMFDGSLPSDKGYLAQSIQELLGIILQAPGAAVQFNLDPKKMIDEIYDLRGVGSLTRFQFDPQEMMRQQMLAQAQQNAANPTQPQPGPGAAPGGPAV